MPPSPQASSLPQLTIKRPLVSLPTVADALDKTHQEVLGLIEAGELLWAWDIGSKNSERRMVRVLAQSLVDYQLGRQGSELPESEQFKRALALLFPISGIGLPGVFSKVRVITIASKFGVKSEHVLGLVDDGLLRLAPNTQRRRGPGGSPDVSFVSLTNFLSARRMT